MYVLFDDFEIDLPKRQLRHRAAALAIKPKDLDVLAYLVRCRDRFVTKDELLDQFWPEPESSEGVLTSTVSRLRRILGADAIQSIRPCSYRFTRSVAEAERVPRRVPVIVPAPRSSDFVGRNNELDRLREAIDAASQGRGGVVLIAGEAGIGKSRIMEEATRYARARGIEALISRSDHEHSQVPYSVWKNALMHYSAARQENGIGAAHSVDLDRDWSALEQGSRISEESDPRLAFFDTVSGVFLRASATAPLLIAFDDLHLADVTSVQLLCFVARRCARSKILVIATLRDAEPGSSDAMIAALAMLRRDPRCTFLPLAPFTEHEALEILNHLGAKVNVAARAAILAAADGNPFLLRECWRRALEGYDADEKGSGQHRVPDVVAELFEPRLARLSPACREMLAAAATCGREFDATLAQRISGFSPPEFADAIDEARRTRFVVAVRGRSAQLRFAHQLVRDFIYERCPPEVRRQYHRRAAENLEAECGDDPGERLAELVHHWQGAAHEDCAEHAIERLQELGDWMWHRLAFEDAIRQLQHCLVLIDRYRPDWQSRRWQVCMSLAWAHQRLGDTVAANAAFDDVRQILGVEAAPAGGRSCSASRVLATGEMVANLPRDRASVKPRWPVLPPARQRASIIAQRMATEGLERARCHGDPAILASALVQLCWRIPDVYSAERLAQSAELLEMAQAGTDRDFEQEARYLHLHYRLVNGDIGGVDDEIAAFAAALPQTPDPLYLWLHECLMAMRTHLDGRFGESEAHALRAAAIGVGSPSSLTQLAMSEQLFAIRTSKGRSAEALPLLEMILAGSPEQTGVRAVIASALCELERFDEARAHLEILSTNRFSAVFETPVSWFTTAVGLARACERLAARREATVLYEAVLPYASTCVVSMVALNCYGATEGYLAMLAAAMGKRGQALDHFDAALATNTRIRAWPVLAHTQYEYARLLLRGTRAERSRGRELLRRARVSAIDFEMSGLAEWIDGLN